MYKYLNPKNYLRYFLNRFVGLAAIALQPLEKYLSQKYGDEGIKKYPPVFIIGAPRCGSTILYKVLTERYLFSFLSNFTARFYLMPAIATWFAKTFGITAPMGNYDFNYGKVNGLGSPHECGEFWYRWFPRGLHVYVAPNITEKLVLKQLRCEIGAVSFITKAPMIFKNLYNSMRIAPIFEAIPEASFIVCRRNYEDNALSILKGRRNLLNDENSWMGTPPKEIDRLIKLSNAKQVAGQVYYVYQQIDEDKTRIGRHRFLEVRYEDFCSDVHGTLINIQHFLSQRGCLLEQQYDVPRQFNAMSVDGIDSKDRKVVALAVRRFFAKQQAPSS